MYQNFKDIPTRSQYRTVLAEAIAYFKAKMDILPEGLNEHVLEQLNDIMLHLDDYESLGDADDIDQRYDIGAIAVNWLEDSSEAQQRLVDVFWGVIHYSEMAEL